MQLSESSFVARCWSLAPDLFFVGHCRPQAQLLWFIFPRGTVKSGQVPVVWVTAKYAHKLAVHLSLGFTWLVFLIGGNVWPLAQQIPLQMFKYWYSSIISEPLVRVWTALNLILYFLQFEFLSTSFLYTELFKYILLYMKVIKVKQTANKSQTYTSKCKEPQKPL